MVVEPWLGQIQSISLFRIGALPIQVKLTTMVSKSVAPNSPRFQNRKRSPRVCIYLWTNSRTRSYSALEVSYKGQAFSFRTHQSGLPAKNPQKLVRSQSGVFDRYMPAPCTVVHKINPCPMRGHSSTLFSLFVMGYSWARAESLPQCG